MNAKITIAACAFVAAMNQASAAIVDADTELRAWASSVALPGDPDFDKADERTATFPGYGSFNVGAEAKSEPPYESVYALADVTASVQPYAIGIGTYSEIGGSYYQMGSSGTATATVNFNLSEAGVWSAKPFAVGTVRGLREAMVSLLKDGQEVYHQDCSQWWGQHFCDPYYEDEYGNIIPVPEYAGRSLELEEGDYTLLLTASDGAAAYDSGGGSFDFDLQLVPVPAALPLFLSGLAALGLIGWRRR